eukprot:gene11314-17384_t
MKMKNAMLIVDAAGRGGSGSNNQASDQPLKNEWQFWLDVLEDTPEASAPKRQALGAIGTIKLFWWFYNKLAPEHLPAKATVQLFRNGIEPSWGHPKNRRGGHYRLTCKTKGHIQRLWFDVALALVGEQFELSGQVCGAGYNISKGSVLFWISDSEDEMSKQEIRRQLINLLPVGASISFRDHTNLLGKESAFSIADVIDPEEKDCKTPVGSSLTVQAVSVLAVDFVPPAHHRVSRSCPEDVFAEFDPDIVRTVEKANRRRAFSEAVKPSGAPEEGNADVTVPRMRGRSYSRAIAKRRNLSPISDSMVGVRKVLSADHLDKYVPHRPIHTAATHMKTVGSWADEEDDSDRSSRCISPTAGDLAEPPDRQPLANTFMPMNGTAMPSPRSPERTRSSQNIYNFTVPASAGTSEWDQSGPPSLAHSGPTSPAGPGMVQPADFSGRTSPTHTPYAIPVQTVQQPLFTLGPAEAHHHHHHHHQHHQHLHTHHHHHHQHHNQHPAHTGLAQPGYQHGMPTQPQTGGQSIQNVQTVPHAHAVNQGGGIPGGGMMSVPPQLSPTQAVLTPDLGQVPTHAGLTVNVGHPVVGGYASTSPPLSPSQGSFAPPPVVTYQQHHVPTLQPQPQQQQQTVMNPHPHLQHHQHHHNHQHQPHANTPWAVPLQQQQQQQAPVSPILQHQQQQQPPQPQQRLSPVLGPLQQPPQRMPSAAQQQQTSSPPSPILQQPQGLGGMHGGYPPQNLYKPPLQPSSPTSSQPISPHTSSPHSPQSPVSPHSPSPKSAKGLVAAPLALTTPQPANPQSWDPSLVVDFLVDMGQVAAHTPAVSEEISELPEKFSKSRSPRNRRKIRERKIREAADAARHEMDIWCKSVLTTIPTTLECLERELAAAELETPDHSWVSPIDNIFTPRPEWYPVADWFRFVQACRKEEVALFYVHKLSAEDLEKLGADTPQQQAYFQRVMPLAGKQPHPFFQICENIKLRGYTRQ